MSPSCFWLTNIIEPCRFSRTSKCPLFTIYSSSVATPDSPCLISCSPAGTSRSRQCFAICDSRWDVKLLSGSFTSGARPEANSANATRAILLQA
eukprot:9470805-Pyramimonas_sp.AAC.1